MKALLKILAPLALAGTLFTAAPASAASDWCWWDSVVFITSCTTANVPANASSHFIYFRVHNPFTHYELRDNNGPIIRSGTTGGGWHYETVFGLYSYYSLRCSGPGGSCDISNT